MTECVCGTCPPCRRELRLAAREVAKPIVLSPLAAAILAEPIGYEPVKPRVRPVQNRRKPEPNLDSQKRATRRRSDNAVNLTQRSTKPPTPTACAQCGGMRAVTTRGGGAYSHLYLTGSGDLCEVCADAVQFRAVLDAFEQSEGDEREALRRKAWRARRFLDRELRDGRAYAPAAPQHGGATAYNKDGCRCEPCRDWKATDNARRRAAA
ncbi:hypothetical protein [Rhodococcus sp. UNC363MFTsu5.1]|uniref:hypothetical protein n=1 Tax=Rhodococcus sp. UNC363MFTsu5.1 TaxID=1449069 RepID=UPI00048454D0|nr:hypothetical protein [Rhodococcus sp. UNC363MFTsu5.1]